MPASSVATEQSAAATALEPAAVRIVVFGTPGAGKSSLLGAFAQALERQPSQLPYHVRVLPEGLQHLRQQVYAHEPRQTADEIVPYPLQVTSARGEAFLAILYDCDGRAANDLLSKARFAGVGQAAARLARAVLEADALVLAVDASADAPRLDRDFLEFKRLLRHLEDFRTEGRQVGGLPVFLVLTKCDQLAEPRMSPHDWEERVEQRKKEVEERFKEFMEDTPDAEDPYYSFGSIDLDVAATSVRQPKFHHAATHADDPVGVAELFRDCLREAERYRERVVRGRQRLVWTVAGSLGFLVMLAIGAVVFTFAVTDRRPELLRKIAAYRSSEGRTAAERLAMARHLDQRLAELTAFLKDAGFDQLPEEARQFVLQRHAELEAYLKFSDELRSVPRPGQARSLPELSRIDEALNKRALPPSDFQTEWAHTEAMRYRDRLVHEVVALRNAVSDLRTFFLNVKSRGTDLLFAAEITPDWGAKVRRLMADADAPPAITDDAIRRLANEFDEVIAAQQEWSATRERLQLLDDFATALGLAVDPTSGKAMLAPRTGEPVPLSDIDRTAAHQLQALRKDFPDFGSWSVSGLPDPVRPQIQARLKRSLEAVLRDGQRMIVARIHLVNPSGPENPADWPKIADWVVSPENKSWRELTSLLARLLDPGAEDPVTALAGFLRKTSFDVELRELRLRIPDNLREARLRPSGTLNVYHRAAGEEPIAALRLRSVGEPVRETDGAMSYTFRPAQGDPRFTYRPGDELWADLRLKEGDRDWQFTWARSRAASYQFERLEREPRLHEPKRESSTGELAEGATISVIDGKLPVVPALLPAVTFASK